MVYWNGLPATIIDDEAGVNRLVIRLNAHYGTMYAKGTILTVAVNELSR